MNGKVDTDFVRQCVARRARRLTQKLKDSGIGSGARSGRHGEARKMAGQQLIEEGNKVGGVVGDILKKEGTQLIQRGNAIGHY